MTESEWLACATPRQLLAALPEPVSERKVRLYACACCRAVWKQLPHAICRQAVEAAERHADGDETAEALARIYRQAHEVYRSQTDRPESAPFALAAAETARPSFVIGARVDATLTLCQALVVYATNPKGNPPVELLRDIFGNPFRPVAVDPDWMARDGAAVVALAREIYDQGDFERTGRLGGALRAAGCDSGELIDHCLRSGPHVRGCVALDRLTGRG